MKISRKKLVKSIDSSLTLDHPLYDTSSNRISKRPQPQIVSSYVKSVLKGGPVKAKQVEVIKQIIRLNIDNRILNNLRWQLNNEVKDEKGLV